MKLVGQPVDPVQIDWHGKEYWKYQSVDQHNNTPFKLNYQYDSAGQYLGWIYEFPRDGEWISFFKEDSKKVASIFNVKDSILNGKLIQYYLSGAVHGEHEYEDGNKIGFVRYWNENGILISEDQYGYGENKQIIKEIGQWKRWNDKGDLKQIINYKEGKLDGVQLEYHENGQIKVEKFYIQGIQDGNQTIFYPNGRISKRRKYIRGKFIEENPYKDFHENGVISGTGNIENGLEKGKWIYYYKSGLKKSEGKYRIHIYPHEHGNLYYSIKEGDWTYWYETGKIKARGSYTEGIIGDILSGQEPNLLSLKSGGWIFYDEKGKEIPYEEFIVKENKIIDL